MVLEPTHRRSAYRTPDAVLAEARRMAADILARAERDAAALRREAAEWAAATRRQAERHRALVLETLGDEHGRQRPEASVTTGDDQVRAALEAVMDPAGLRDDVRPRPGRHDVIDLWSESQRRRPGADRAESSAR